MKITGILAKGDPKIINNLWNRYCERLDSNIIVYVLGEGKYLGTLKEVNMNPEQTILYGKFSLIVDKYKDFKVTTLETKIDGEPFVRKFSLEEK